MKIVGLAATSLLLTVALAGDSASFDLAGPSIDVRVTRGAHTLPIARVPNLRAGDRLWPHPVLPAHESVHIS